MDATPTASVAALGATTIRRASFRSASREENARRSKTDAVRAGRHRDLRRRSLLADGRLAKAGARLCLRLRVRNADPNGRLHVLPTLVSHAGPGGGQPSTGDPRPRRASRRAWRTRSPRGSSAAAARRGPDRRRGRALFWRTIERLALFGGSASDSVSETAQRPVVAFGPASTRRRRQKLACWYRLASRPAERRAAPAARSRRSGARGSTSWRARSDPCRATARPTSSTRRFGPRARATMNRRMAGLRR